MWDYNHFGMGMLGPGMILFWGLLIALLILVIRTIIGRNNAHGAEPSALDILQARYARGEIDETEYRTRRAELEK